MSPSILPKKKHLTEDKPSAENKDLTAHEDLRVKPLFFHRPSFASSYDSAESIATPPRESDLDDKQIRAAGFTTVHAGARSKCGENLMCTEKPVALFSSKNRSNQETFSDREDFSSEHQQVLGNTESLLRFSHREILCNLS